MQLPMHAQKRLRTQLARILGMADHAINYMPHEAMEFAHQTFKRARHFCKHRFDQGSI